MRQYVKTYQKKIGDFRQKTKDMSIEEQINQDLEKNPDWFIHILQYKSDGNSCTVVFNLTYEWKIQTHVNDTLSTTCVDSSTTIGDITSHNADALSIKI